MYIHTYIYIYIYICIYIHNGLKVFDKILLDQNISGNHTDILLDF